MLSPPYSRCERTKQNTSSRDTTFRRNVGIPFSLSNINEHEKSEKDTVSFNAAFQVKINWLFVE